MAFVFGTISPTIVNKVTCYYSNSFEIMLHVYLIPKQTNMNLNLLFLLLGSLLFLSNVKSQCIDTLPANTVMITSDTTISSASGNNTYLICPGVNVNYTGGQSTLNTYYMEDSASLDVNSYHYPQLYMQTGAEVIANHSVGPPSYLITPTAEPGAIFTDTIGSYVDPITWCGTLTFNYSNLPGGVGCPSVNPPCVEVIPANTVIITSDTVITNSTGMNNYLICPGVEVTYNGGQSTFNNYYMEDSASLEINSYHYPQVYTQSGTEVIANHSVGPPSYLMSPISEYGTIYTDTIGSYVDPITWCTTLTFDYSNLPGGVGCPSVNPPCVEVIPANTVIITSDTVIANSTGMNNYLICPGVEVTYNGGQSTFNNYYMEDSASLEINSYHYPQVYTQSGAEVIANHSVGPPSYLMSPISEYGTIYTDTIGSYVDPITWCTNLIFDYSNLPGGVGCPTMTAIDEIMSTNFATIYPNPAYDYIVIDFQERSSDYQIRLNNSLGQTIYQSLVTEDIHRIDMSNGQEQGIYFLSILDEKNRILQVKKIILR